ncbi:hypothetical protein CR513_29124, partial [Mucuna pruriens]
MPMYPKTLRLQNLGASSITSPQVDTCHSLKKKFRLKAKLNQPLHIAVKCGNYMIARVLIDNGSSLNVMPKTTLDKLYTLGAILKNSNGLSTNVQLPIRMTLDLCYGSNSFIPASKGQIRSRWTTD